MVDPTKTLTKAETKPHLLVSSGKLKTGDMEEINPGLPGPRGLCCTATANWSASAIDVASTRRHRSLLRNSLSEEDSFPCKAISCAATAVLKY